MKSSLELIKSIDKLLIEKTVGPRVIMAELLEACRSNDRKELRRLLCKRRLERIPFSSIHLMAKRYESDDSSLLLLAIEDSPESCVEDILKFLIASGENINDLIDMGILNLKHSALSLMCIRGKENIVKILLDLDADVNVIDSDGRKPIHNAINNGSLNIVKQLISVGADHDAKISVGQDMTHAYYKPGFRPIDIAVHKKYDNIVKFLIEECGAELSEHREPMN